MDTPNTHELAERVSQVAKLYNSSDKSTAGLLKDAGFTENREALRVDDVEGVLKRDPNLTDLWLKRANDQRIAGGWGIEGENGAYRVQSYSDGHCLHLEDRGRACAEFVVRYVNFIADALARSPQR